MELRKYFNLFWKWAWLVVLSVAIAAGASGDLIEKVAAQMVTEKIVRIDRAEEILKSIERG